MYPLTAILSAVLTSCAIAAGVSLSPDPYSFLWLVAPVFAAVTVASVALGFVAGRALLLPSIIAACVVLTVAWSATLLYATETYLRNSLFALAATCVMIILGHLTGSYFRSSLRPTRRPDMK